MGRVTYISAALALVLLIALGLTSSPDAGALGTDCAAADITIHSCKVSAEMVWVSFRADTNSPVERLDYTFTSALGSELKYGPVTSPGWTDITLRMTGRNEYTFVAGAENAVADVHIVEPACLPEVYVSSRATCELIEESALVPEDSVCADYPTMEGRVRCRFYNVEPPSIDTPEECRILTGSKREDCISRHTEMAPCLAEEEDAAALECAEEVIGLGNLTASKLECGGLAAGSQPACIQALREKAYRMARFKFQLLGRKARSLLWQGVTEETIVTFISNLEVRTQAFNSVGTVAEKTNIVNQVQQLWDEFLFTAEPQVLSYREVGDCATCQ